ncbi:hypothetical protein HPB47_024898 [Ixodes persulcatus]|uniref:Uncharacterized protein n=1 Tax=Ixodes persulcatus TaxID=34615 RepID=A0AC60Q4W3_IXOPE|nr:hypothetical protein HPB47_024898 [Ixodes persulcatus]
MDAKHLLDFMPQGVNHLILHLGTNDLATANISLALTSSSNRSFVARFNSKAQGFNGGLPYLRHQAQNTFFLDQCFDHLPVRLVMAADGVHASFAGVSYLAWNVH